MIKHVRITNFRSLEDVAVDLDPVTVLIGRSGTGKSNFVDALRWLREVLTLRNADSVQGAFGGWQRILSATTSLPRLLSFELTFTAPRISEEYTYAVGFVQKADGHSVGLVKERLTLGARALYHQEHGKWVEPPALVHPPGPGSIILGGLTGIPEVTVAHLVLTQGIGCYSFPDRVLTHPQPVQQKQDTGLADDGANFMQAYTAINVNLDTWHHLRGIAASLRVLKPTLRNLDLEQPGRGRIAVSHESEGRLLVFDLAQESEGVRRLLACLIALYQTPSKQTLLFDEPEKGIYPLGLAILADEFKGFASKRGGQVILTTHSPDFLDHFAPENIRAVEMRDFATHIGPVAPDQLKALHEQYMTPKDLLGFDEPRLQETATASSE